MWMWWDQDAGFFPWAARRTACERRSVGTFSISGRPIRVRITPIRKAKR